MILAAVSGGLDSVAMLWRLLTGSDTPVHVYHASLRSNTERWRREDAAMAQIVPWIRNAARHFDLTSELVEARGYDIVTIADRCGELCRKRHIRPTAFARGSNAHDLATDRLNAARADADRAWSEWWESAPPVIYPIGEMTRSELWRSIPEELGNLTWSCRIPGDDQCGTCATCIELVREGVPLTRKAYQ